jgi:putative hemolysin
MISIRPACLLALNLVVFTGCSAARDETNREAVLDPEATEETVEERALKEWAKAGPGTTTVVNCAGGSARIVARADGSSVLCRGPNGSTTTTSIVCEHGEAKSVTRSDQITVFCPQRPDRTVAKSGK